MTKKYEENVSFIIPALNEESNIKKTVKAGLDCELVDEVLVVDGKSKDKTSQIAKKSGAKVLTQEGSGKGDAIKTGVRNTKAEICVFMDADILNIQPKMIEALSKSILEGEDFVISDFDREGGRITELVAKPLLKKFFPKINVNQPLTGEFAVRTNILNETPIRDGWGAQIDILLNNWLDQNVDCKEKHIGFKDHDRKPLEELIEMSEGVANAILEQAEIHNRIDNIKREMEIKNKFGVENKKLIKKELT